MATNSPPPTTLVTFSDLHNCILGDKVRFLGCVTGYRTDIGEVTLQHKSQDCRDKTALVDVNLLLETLNTPLMRIGEWVSVIGYVTEQESKPGRDGKILGRFTSVQAIIYWSAGAIKVEEYEEAVAKTQTSSLAI